MTQHAISPVTDSRVALAPRLPALAPRLDAVAPRHCARTLLTIEVLDTPDVLVRVLTTLRSRRCTITHVDYVAGDRHRPGQLVVGIEPPRAHGHCVAAWLLNLVDVVAVDSAPLL